MVKYHSYFYTKQKTINDVNSLLIISLHALSLIFLILIVLRRWGLEYVDCILY